MNLLPHYILINKILSRLSEISNNIYRIVPAGMVFSLTLRKTLKAFDHENLRGSLTGVLGDFGNYSVSGSERDELLNMADKVLAHQFDLLGSGEVKLDPVDWQTDFKSGFTWPKGKFYLDYTRVDLTNDADVKVPWELSRCQHFLILGQAYLLTGNEKYTNKFIEQINHWIDDNPLMRSINWRSTLDVSIRAVNWLYSLNMFISSPGITGGFIRKVSRSLYEHGWFIYRNPEKGFPYSDNHYSGNLAGLLFMGTLFKTTAGGKRWSGFAGKEFYREVRNQVLPDGVHFERSVSYHRFVTEFFFYSYLLLKRQGIIVPSDILNLIRRMFVFIVAFTKPDGQSPHIGDQDDGRVLPFRSTKMHNSVSLDGQDQHIADRHNVFKLAGIAYPFDNHFETCYPEDRFSGAHNGYLRLNEPVIHERQILFRKDKLVFEITDHLKGEVVHDAIWHFHFNTGLDVELSGESSVSPSYGIKMEAKKADISARVVCPCSNVIEISKV